MGARALIDWPMMKKRYGFGCEVLGNWCLQTELCKCLRLVDRWVDSVNSTCVEGGELDALLYGRAMRESRKGAVLFLAKNIPIQLHNNLFITYFSSNVV